MLIFAEVMKEYEVKSMAMAYFQIVFQLLSPVWLFATPYIATCQASLSFIISWSLFRFMSIESGSLSNHFVLLPSSPFAFSLSQHQLLSSESTLCIRWTKYWSFSINITPSNEHSGLTYFGWTNWISLQSKGLSRVFSNTTVQKHHFFSFQLSS